MKLNRKIIAAMLAISMVTATAENNVMTAEAASKPSVTKQLTITEGKKKTITVKGSFIKSKSFKSTNKSIATVSKKGVVTAVSKGKCKVKVTVKYRKKKNAKKVLKKEYVTQITVNAKKKTDPTKEPEVTQTPSGQETSAPGTEATKDPSSNTDVSAAPVPPSAVPEATPDAPAETPKPTSAPTATPKATANPGVTVKPETPGTSQNYYPIPNAPSSKNTPTPAPTKTPDVPDGEAVENVVINVSQAVSGGVATFTDKASIDFSSQLDKRFDLKYFKELKVGYTLKFKEGGDESLLDPGKIALVSDPGKLNGEDDGIALTYNMKPNNDTVTINLYKDEEKLSGTAVGINIQPMNSKAQYSWPESLESVTINSIVFIALEDAKYPAETTPTQKPTEPTQKPTEPTQKPTEPTQKPTEPATGSAVEDVTIDLDRVEGKVNSYNNPNAKNEGVKFSDSSMNSIIFNDCLPEVFDLKYFKELKVGYEIEKGSEIVIGGKIALVADKDKLNGYDGGIAEYPSVNSEGNEAIISLTDGDGNKLTGPVAGINIQLNGGAWDTNLPATWGSITITSIEFIALPDQKY